MNPSLVAGADGSKAGWVFVVLDTEKQRIHRGAVAPTFSELLLQTSDCAAVGILARIRLLSEVGLTEGLEELAGDLGKTGLDDLLDATAVAWTTDRIVREDAFRVPETAEMDVRGLRMEMWR